MLRSPLYSITSKLELGYIEIVLFKFQAQALKSRDLYDF